MGKKIMILGAGILQIPAIVKAKEMGLEVVAVDIDPNAVGWKESGIIREEISTIDIPNVLKSAQKHKIDGIMTLASDMPVRTAAVVSRELGLAGITEETALKATNKNAMRMALREYGVPIPLFYCVSSKKECLEAIRKIREKGYECILKPEDNSGSRGIELLRDYSDRAIERAFDYSIQYSKSGNLMIEEFMEGPEVSVETLSRKGECHVVQITDKLTTGAPYFVEMGHSQPAVLEKSVKKKICETAIAANRAIGIEEGPSHTEIKMTKDGPKIVELGARLGGDNITTHLVPLSTGVDMVECCIKIALGEEADIIPKFKRGSAVRYFHTEIGKIKSVEGISEAKNIAGIEKVHIVHGVGSTAGEIKSSVDRAGFVIAQADTSEEAVEICNRALGVIKIEIE